jgi:hypothetical protein
MIFVLRVRSQATNGRTNQFLQNKEKDYQIPLVSIQVPLRRTVWAIYQLSMYHTFLSLSLRLDRLILAGFSTLAGLLFGIGNDCCISAPSSDVQS